MDLRWKRFFFDLVSCIFLAAFITFCLWLVTSCSPKVITVPEYHYEYNSKTDTILRQDTIMSEKNTIIREADSAMVAELGLRLKEGERAILILRKELEKIASQQKEVIRDTVIKTDSIRVPYPVEKELSWWQKQKVKWGETAMAAMFVLLLIAGIRLYRKK